MPLDSKPAVGPLDPYIPPEPRLLSRGSAQAYSHLLIDVKRRQVAIGE
jgi:hypothetical protein